ncbi:VanW family protein [Paenibacillus sp. IB182496]|uniref:VanW family protein n=1 Tax=Paenibacillus sabuli TaxID=2772509 RepID=A0A927GUI5_9BACL|nr:VanW family protein [Paenibacillus sabuli]MBD2847742.1 VanW family protein [Paenibacillus sabuli]
MRWIWYPGLLLVLLFAPQAAAATGWTITHEQTIVAEVQAADYTLAGTSLIDLGALETLMDRIDEHVARAPVNARIGSSGAIEAERTGVRLDRRAFTAAFAAHVLSGGPGRLQAPLMRVHARVDRELLAQIKEQAIGRYATYFNAANRNRSHNIALAAQAINNTVVFPGEQFSFNAVVGERTLQKGYLRAPVIVRGELAEDVGGGICQVSSTLYNAADRAGMEIVNRYSHSRRVPYVRPGRDATVSWGGPDFVFRNAYNQPVLIRAAAYGGSMYVSLYSSELIEFHPREVPGVSGEAQPEALAMVAGAYVSF